MRAGDSVKHRLHGWIRIVAAMDGEFLYLCGSARLRCHQSEVDVLKSCSDQEHIALVFELANQEVIDPRVALSRQLLLQTKHVRT